MGFEQFGQHEPLSDPNSGKIEIPKEFRTKEKTPESGTRRKDVPKGPPEVVAEFVVEGTAPSEETRRVANRAKGTYPVEGQKDLPPFTHSNIDEDQESSHQQAA
ncbi:MAG: hypothetical protein ABIO72_03790 [Patescibacteria group bacterium]